MRFWSRIRSSCAQTRVVSAAPLLHTFARVSLCASSSTPSSSSPRRRRHILPTASVSSLLTRSTRRVDLDASRPHQSAHQQAHRHVALVLRPIPHHLLARWQVVSGGICVQGDQHCRTHQHRCARQGLLRCRWPEEGACKHHPRASPFLPCYRTLTHSSPASVLLSGQVDRCLERDEHLQSDARDRVHHDRPCW